MMMMDSAMDLKKCLKREVSKKSLEELQCDMEPYANSLRLVGEVSMKTSIGEVDEMEEEGGVEGVLDNMDGLFDLVREELDEEDGDVSDQELLELILMEPQDKRGALSVDDFGGDTVSYDTCVKTVITLVARCIATFLCMLGLSGIGGKIGTIVANSPLFSVKGTLIAEIKRIFLRNAEIAPKVMSIISLIVNTAVKQVSVRFLIDKIYNEVGFWGWLRIGVTVTVMVIAILASKGAALLAKFAFCILSLIETFVGTIEVIVKGC